MLTWPVRLRPRPTSSPTHKLERCSGSSSPDAARLYQGAFHFELARTRLRPYVVDPSIWRRQYTFPGKVSSLLAIRSCPRSALRYIRCGPETRPVEVQMVSTPETTRVVPIRRPLRAEQTHPLIRDGNQLSTAQVLQRHLLVHPSECPCSGQGRRARKGTSTQFVDDPKRSILHLRGDVDADPTQPRVLPMSAGPRDHLILETVQLSVATVSTCPHIG